MIGHKLSHYQVLEKIGEGGMGVVYKARDTSLGRMVALKVLPPDALGNEDRKRRFLQEARAASSLNHPNIVTIYDIAQAEGLDFIVMEYVDGQPLNRRIPPAGLPVKEAVSYAAQIASALCAAHDAGIIHRDIKPANILVTASATVKVLDFGLAKLTRSEPLSETDATMTSVGSSEHTQRGVVLGTISYMSPEQAEGKPVDARSDVFSFGLVLFEMLSGRRPFQGDSNLATMTAILRDPLPPVDAPESVRKILQRATAKDRASRYPSSRELKRDLDEYQQALTSGSMPALDVAAEIKRPRVLVPAVALLVILAMGTAWLVHKNARARWARRAAIPQVAEMASQGRFVEAVDLAREAEQYASGDPKLAKLWPEISKKISLHTTPEGADVWFKPYSAPESAWRFLGQSPLSNVVIPHGDFLWKLSKSGYATSFGFTWMVTDDFQFALAPLGNVPTEMISVPRIERFTHPLGSYGNLGPYPIGHFLMDKFEVTNRMYKAFVDQGGYRKKEYWKQPFVKGGRSLSFEETMAGFVDKTGRPGPATWEAGAYPDGQDDFPVSGVSWFEAAAYAEFAGKKLPTIAHWYRAAGPVAAGFIVPVSNFAGKGVARAGEYKGVGPFGTYDMAGNVSEWCWNATQDGMRFNLGGAWNSSVYQFTGANAKSPFDRAAVNGFRCVRYDGALPEAMTAAFVSTPRDYFKEKPASGEVFQAYRANFSYDRADLKASVEATDDSSPHWIKQRVSFAAAYAGERVPAYVFLPKSASRPFQAVVFHASAGAVQKRPSTSLVEMERIDYVIRSGRAVIYPVIRGMYERQADVATPLQRRQNVIRAVQDVLRSVDYLESRPDIDTGRIGYLGASLGASRGPLVLAVEDRFKLGVLIDGGLPGVAPLPEVDPFNYVTRVQKPVLMLNGRYDFTFPHETSQKPLLQLLGTPQKDKRQVMFDTPHDVFSYRTETIREILNWLDHYLGVVRR